MNLENKNSFLLNSALFFSTMGSTATTLGFITYIFNTTHSPFNTGAVTIATLLVGMFRDTCKRKRLNVVYGSS